MNEATFQAPQPEQLSKLLPTLDVQALIAQGGMGAVYKARQKSLDRDVAIKVLPREIGRNPEFRFSFETEAKAMAKLNHRNLIGVYDFGDVEGMPYIVMEYVHGSSLYDSSWGKIVAPEQAVALVRAICDGLGHAHENGILHRDIKPANILLTPKAEPKIGDFGLAQSIDDGGDGLIMGTPGYTAPEVILGHRPPDHRADIYAVGVILHELITGQGPDPEYKKPFQASTDPRLDQIWSKATAPDPAQRYSSAYDMAADLDSWAAAPSLLRTAVEPVPATVPRPRGAVPTASGGGRVVKVVAIAVLAAVIGVTWNHLKRAKQDVRHDNQEVQRREALKEQRKLSAERVQMAEDESAEAHGAEGGQDDETLDESLARVKKALLAGLRTQMPLGAKHLGESYFLFIDKPMSWQEASAFAEAYDGHLVTLTEEFGIDQLVEFIPENSAVWVGVGRLDTEQWLQVDGTPWPLSQKPVGVGGFVSLDRLGVARAQPQHSRLPFIVQWRADATNPGSLEAMLRRASDTLDDDAPNFPPGTRFQEARRFCVIERALPRQEALELAEISGGKLAEPSTREEQIWLEEFFDHLESPSGLWLGGEKKGANWGWLSGEDWGPTAWSEQALPEPGGAGLVFVPGEGWKDADPDRSAAGFIIEWSHDGGTGVVSEAGEPALEPGGDGTPLEDG